MMATAAQRVLVVEDNERLGRQMVAALEGAGYETTWLRRGDEALAAACERYSVVVLDVMLPGASGFDVLAHVRRRGIATPVVMATARTAPEDRQRALELGAADYLTKPFWPQELVNRVSAQLDAAGSAPQDDVTEVDELSIDYARREVRVDGVSACLEPVEFELVRTLARRRGAAVSTASLLPHVTAPDGEPTAEALDRLVLRVKEKLGRAGTRIRRVWGVGYRLEI